MPIATLAPSRHPMSRHRTILQLCAVLAAVVLAKGCGDGGDPAEPEPPRPTTVTISPATAALTALGTSVQLSAQVLDQNGQAMAATNVAWSSNNTAVASVNATGLVTAAANGTATITATAGSASSTATVTMAQAVATVAVAPATDTLLTGDTLRLAAAATDANGHAVADAEFTWVSSDTLVAVVDDAGLVTGLGAGEAEIAATAAAVSGRAILAVVAPVPTTVSVTPDTVVLTAIGQAAQVAAEVRDQGGHVMVGARVSWSSADTMVAEVDSTGLVTAAGGGTTVVTVAAGGASAGAVVTVMQSADSVDVSPPAATVAVGDTLRLVAEAFDENAHRIEGAEFDWSSSDSSVARVDGSGLLRGVAEGVASVTATAGNGRGRAEITVVPRRKPGPGLGIFNFPMRAIAVSGYWGTNREVVQPWEDGGRQGPVLPAEFIAWLRGMHVNWVLISVALHYEDSMDSSVSRETDRSRNVPTWRDESLRQVIREFREHGFDIYMTLAFEAHEAETSARPLDRGQLGDPAPPHTGGVPPGEGPGPIKPENWPWRTDHPDHQRFTAEFWETYSEQAEHFASIAEDAGVALFSLGTETDALFRTRPDPGYMINDFGDELRSMVDRVRAVYSGRLTYNMHYSTVMYADHYGRGSGAGHLWEDLDLDVVGISGWFPLTESAPNTVLSVPELQASYESIFQKYLAPLAGRNPGRAIVFTEYGSMDVVEAPADPSSGERHSELKILIDRNRNGLDDGEETQANIFEAFFETSARYPGLVNGAFFWDNWIATDAMWADYWLDRRSFAVRGKLAEAVVRDAYARLAGARR